MTPETRRTRASQRDQLLQLLKRYSPEWVPLPEVMAAGGAQYGTRVFELRTLGHQIENKPCWFRLVTRPVIPEKSPPAQESRADEDSLFGDLSRTPEYPD